MTELDDVAAGLRSKVMRGLAWKAGSQVSLQITRVIVAVILARLLSPHDVGLAAMVMIFAGLVVLIADSALGTALIQRAELAAGDRSTVFWLGTGAGALCTVAGIALSGPLADFYGEPEVKPLFAALSLSFVVTALSTTQAALLIRDLDFQGLEVRRMIATLVGAVVGVALALEGFGAWALVGQQLVIGAVTTALLWEFSSWRPSFTFSWASVRDLGEFGGIVFAQNVLYQIGRNLNNVVIGRFLGASPLGLYSLAQNTILSPFHQIAGPVQQVLFPAFSRLQSDFERMADVWIRVTRIVAAITVPALIGLIVVAPDFVPVVLGSRWEDVTPVIQILAWAGIVQSLQTLTGEILLALGRARTLFLFTLLWLAASVAAVSIGLRWGIVGVAICYAVASTLVEPINAYLAARALGTSLTRFARSLAGIFGAAALMGATALGVRVALIAIGVGPAARLVIVSAVGVVAFAGFCTWLARDVLLDARNLIPVRRPRVRPKVVLDADG